MNTHSTIRMIMLIGFIILVLSGLWYGVMFTDCVDRGHAMYQCNAALNNGHYVGIEQWEGNR